MFVLLALLLCSPGERLSYELRYGPMRIGELQLSELEPSLLAGNFCRHYRADIKIAMTPAWLFSAGYRLESRAREQDTVTVLAYKRTREPNYRAEVWARLNAAGDSMCYSSGKCVPVLPQARDLVTVWYWLRGQRLRAGDTISTNVHVDQRNYRIRAAVGSPRLVRVAAGTFNCVPIYPANDGPLGLVYVSNDSRRLPVVIRTRFGGLAVTASLNDFTEGGE